AKPYDYVPPPKDGDKNTGTTSSGASKSTKADYSQYPDYVFLSQLDKDGDERISRDEFENWARNYAVQVKQQVDAQMRLAAMEQRLLTPALAAKERNRLEAEMRKEQNALAKFDKEMKAFEKHLQQAMKNSGKGTTGKPPKK